MRGTAPEFELSRTPGEAQDAETILRFLHRRDFAVLERDRDGRWWAGLDLPSGRRASFAGRSAIDAVRSAESSHPPLQALSAEPARKRERKLETWGRRALRAWFEGGRTS
jgi:hypothetical protein